MAIPRELNPVECVNLIEAGGIGRLAVCTPSGPEIFPLNFTVDGQSVVFRTTPYSALGTLVADAPVAFEVDHANWSSRQGWSVVLKGRAEVVDDPDEVHRLRELGHDPQPWAQGVRRLYVRVAWTQITGRKVGEEWLSGSPPADHVEYR